MAQQYRPNVMQPETRAASDAAALAHPEMQIRLKKKYTEVGIAKVAKKKTGGNSGKVGRRWRSYQRAYVGSDPPREQKLASAEQSAAFLRWRAGWMTGDPGPQPG